MKSVSAPILIVIGSLVMALPPRVRAQAEDNLLMMSTTLPREAERWYQDHYGDTTRSQFSIDFARVYVEPRPEALVLGVLSAAARWNTYLHFAWVYRPADGDSSFVWREDIGDWGYGVDQFVVDTVAGWVELPPGPYGHDAWVRLVGFDETDGFDGEVRSIAGNLVRLEKVRAENMDTGGVEQLTGTMMVESIEKGIVTFRPEVPSDMPCSPEDEELPDPAVPRYRAPISAFVTNDLQPRFDVAYPKGC